LYYNEEDVNTNVQIVVDFMYPVSQKLHTFYFCNNFAECQPIFKIIFDTLTPE